MALTGAGEIVASARRRKAGVGAFNVIQIETAEAIVSAAESAEHPVILQISENCVSFHGSLEPLALATLALARRSTVPVAVHLDHAESAELINEALLLGLGSVMFDASRSSYPENVERTREVVRRCHASGVWVEAELGEIGGKDGAHAPGVRTDPHQAAEYVSATGVDALAVAVGSRHAMTTRDARLDLALIAELRSRLAVPLVLHGSSGVGDDHLRAAVRAGMTKINVSTHLNKAFTEAVRDYLRAHPDVVDTRRYFKAGREAITAQVEALIHVLDAPRAESS